jgi:hypothetical protein
MFPPLIDVDGVSYVVMMISIDRSRGQVRIQTGGIFSGVPDNARERPDLPDTPIYKLPLTGLVTWSSPPAPARASST